MKFSRLLLGVIASFVLGAAAQAAPLKVGVYPGAIADSLETAAAEARKQGIDVKVIEFTDWTTPNSSLAAGDLDANYYQHQAFLDNVMKERGFKLKSVGVGLRGNMGLFSAKIQRIEDLKEGAKLALANDPTNQTRSLLLLQDAGLVKIRPNVAKTFTLDDVVENPRKLKFVELGGPQLVRAFEDVDLVVATPNNFISAGKKDVAAAGLRYSQDNDGYWAIQFVVRADAPVDPRLTKLIEIYQQSPAVRKQIHDSYDSNAKYYSLPWLKK